MLRTRAVHQSPERQCTGTITARGVTRHVGRHNYFNRVLQHVGGDVIWLFALQELDAVLDAALRVQPTCTPEVPVRVAILRFFAIISVLWTSHVD